MTPDALALAREVVDAAERDGLVFPSNERHVVLAKALVEAAAELERMRAVCEAAREHVGYRFLSAARGAVESRQRLRDALAALTGEGE